MYTGVVDKKNENGKHYVRQVQCIAIGDGENYFKLDSNPVITDELLPEGSSFEDFRDPKIWKEDGDFYSVVASRSKDGSGQILMFKSENLKTWELVTILDKSENKLGRMWECPDFFNIDGKIEKFVFFAISLNVIFFFICTSPKYIISKKDFK